ncbi:DDE-type integrase/transposase/recombinase [Methylonatrum kenyense]|uniref:DDE-type integrase/transposase/recombinase n=1 Tax=Methylonatrum kenyense TaxID=455253 RepID=UPI003D0E1C77
MSREVSFGWAMADHMRTKPVTDALTMTVGRRRPAPGLLHHADQGSQYASGDYQALLVKHRMVPSMSRRGNLTVSRISER